ncbi:MAG: NADPH-dependent assimilatory sulfite reductase hemoprotein subunit [Verrucomicrobia bacterium]|nr:MAG: NADPH-dependent assimilatory sulfite reductase hemoprotein subunit [Verrucomicrobiota bacterium]
MAEAAESTKSLTRNEVLKTNIPTLAGNLAATLADPAAACFSSDDEQFLKFHGIYQQDDRDKRKIAKHYMFMIRGRIPGGVLTSAQYRVFDDLATRHGNQTLRITTRQSIQFHGVVKAGLGPLMKSINESLLDTLAACGDVNRNVMAAPTPAFDNARRQLYEHSRLVSDSLLPKTRAYHAIWVEGVQLDLAAAENKDFVDPLYGKQYLPRKFKVAFVIPPSNDMDVLANDLGFIAVVENGNVVGYNLAVGGGMGRSHGNEGTFPRLADVLGFFTPDKLVDIAKAVLTIHRDFGDRTDRKHARLKYVIAERGTDWAKAEIERRADVVLGAVRPFEFKDTADIHDWHPQGDGKWFLGLHVSMGRIKDEGVLRLKTALRTVAEQFPAVEFRLTANQNLLLADVAPDQKDAVDALLAAHGVRTSRQTTVLHAGAIGCPSLPTCGLGLAESERFLPGLLDRIEALAAEVGLAGQEIVIRMTGCPNGCARPYLAEIGFVGKAPGRYQVWLGGNAPGTRINRVWKELLKEAEIEQELRPLLVRYAAERTPGERFGDWVARVFWNESAPTPAAN